jgi:hypothetical protein
MIAAVQRDAANTRISLCFITCSLKTDHLQDLQVARPSGRARANKKLGGNRLLKRSQSSCGSKGNAGSMRRQARKLSIYLVIPTFLAARHGSSD